MRVCCVVVVVVVHIIRLLDVAMRFLPFTYATGLLLLFFIRQLLAQMATTRKRVYCVCSVSQYEEKKRKEKKCSREKRAHKMRTNDVLFFFLFLVLWILD